MDRDIFIPVKRWSDFGGAPVGAPVWFRPGVRLGAADGW